ncbi:DnaJ family domain-containing protein [Paludibacterium yongneupense]|uniref:DnaJ family domain-containing protein n=1 Tax=Paludibacterium yongneupense TaxID=400061 RepID=UPI00042848D1|nr:DnaJ family domain-containing protein [Paludibacterium yongneupense]
MDFMERLGEARLNEAVEQGAFDHLPGAGAPLEIDDYAMIPPDERMAYHILKNAGLLPPALEARREAVALAGRLLEADADDADSAAALKRLQLLNVRLAEAGLPTLALDGVYGARVLERFK